MQSTAQCQVPGHGDVLDVLAPARYPWRFNSPRFSRHRIEVRRFAPLNYVSRRIEGVTLFNPWPPRRFDLIHAFNRIPLESSPFVIGFESHLPRGFGIEQSRFFARMRAKLAGTRCKAIIAISEYAARQFLRQHAGTTEAETLRAKLLVRYPNLRVPATPRTMASGDTVRLVFVGNHFGRKGGSVAVRVAELARARGLSLHLDVVSAFEVGTVSWTDPLSPGYFDADRERLRLPNVTAHGALPNVAVLELVGNAHFSLLPTFSDTFGYSVIESMAQGTPAVVTAQGALPEFVHHGVNGMVLPMATDAVGEWGGFIGADRASSAYAAMHRQEVERLAELTLEAVITATADPDAYQCMRRAAHETASTMFGATEASGWWDELYVRALRGNPQALATAGGATA